MPGTFTATAAGGGAGPGGIGDPPGGPGSLSVSPEAVGKVKLFGGAFTTPSGTFANYNSNIFLHPSPLQPLSLGLAGPPRFCTGGTNAPGNGVPGGARIYYEVPAP